MKLHHIILSSGIIATSMCASNAHAQNPEPGKIEVTPKTKKPTIEPQFGRINVETSVATQTARRFDEIYSTAGPTLFLRGMGDIPTPVDNFYVHPELHFKFVDFSSDNREDEGLSFQHFDIDAAAEVRGIMYQHRPSKLSLWAGAGPAYLGLIEKQHNQQITTDVSKHLGGIRGSIGFNYKHLDFSYSGNFYWGTMYSAFENNRRYIAQQHTVQLTPRISWLEVPMYFKYRRHLVTENPANRFNVDVVPGIQVRVNLPKHISLNARFECSMSPNGIDMTQYCYAGGGIGLWFEEKLFR